MVINLIKLHIEKKMRKDSNSFKHVFSDKEQKARMLATDEEPEISPTNNGSTVPFIP